VAIFFWNNFPRLRQFFATSPFPVTKKDLPNALFFMFPHYKGGPIPTWTEFSSGFPFFFQKYHFFFPDAVSFPRLLTAYFNAANIRPFLMPPFPPPPFKLKDFSVTLSLSPVSLSWKVLHLQINQFFCNVEDMSLQPSPPLGWIASLFIFFPFKTPDLFHLFHNLMPLPILVFRFRPLYLRSPMASFPFFLQGFFMTLALYS